MKFSRVWAMPSSSTFEIKPIREFVMRHLQNAKTSIDPYARNQKIATYTNDLNPNTLADSHEDATDFINALFMRGIRRVDAVIVDPPYSPRQVKECYDSVGLKMQKEDALLGKTRKRLKIAINQILSPGGVVLHFGWNSVGMGIGLGFKIEEILLVCHGSDHNDTICLAERKCLRTNND